MAAVLLSVKLGSITGLHGDEAWVMLATKAIALGWRPLDGMNTYTGPLHLYMLWPLFELFGYKVSVVRAFGMVLATGTAVSAVLLARETLAADRVYAGWVGLLLVVSPVYVLYSRMTTEITVLVPFLLKG